MSETVLTAILGLIGLFFTSGAYLATLSFIKWKQKPKKLPIEKELDDVAEIYECLHECRRKTHALRVVLLRLHNGGGRPKAGSPMFSSAIYEVYRDDQNPIVKDWQNERIDNDEQYREMLLAMFDGGCTRVIVDNMKPGKLRDVYKVTGVVRNIIVDVGYRSQGKEHFYMSIVFDENTPLKLEEENYAARVCQNHVKEILKCE